jgi:ribosome assembly protein RRB1
VAGTQADVGAQNRLYLLKMSQLHKTRNDDVDSDDEDADDDDDGEDEDAALTFRQIKHPGGTNRVRSLPSQAHVVATWSDNGKIYIWNTLQHIHALDVPPAAKLKSVAPIETLSGHRTEGYALSWNSTVEGRLGTADCNGDIFVWLPAEAGWKCETPTALRAHQGSVEDLHWNPAQADVFSTCSVDGTIKIWDLRQRAVGLTIKAHSSDVNVMSWNRAANHLIVSGGDDAVFNVWDLRLISQGQTGPARSFNWHKGPITSIEWNPNDESSIIVSSEDNTVTLWDIALTNEDTGDALDEKLPPELLFIHQGQDQIKEVHWHPQIPDVLISTAADGFNVFKPNITPQEGE